VYVVLAIKLDRRNNLVDPCIDGRIISEWMLQEEGINLIMDRV
jgi:hypothetical protein